tara:strand:+ start:348 stop:539 length:192 start_codon:yes stop_codon:yes gene_type:complete
MYLDESILQSRTTLSLVEFIDELMEWVGNNEIENKGLKYRELHKKYIEVKEKANKASKKRSFK